MKRALMIVIVLLFSALVFAQTGMFGIEFNAPLSRVNAALEAAKFTQTELESSSAKYTNNTKPNLISLTVRFEGSEKVISGWTIEWDLSTNTTDDVSILNEIRKLHGETDVEDDFDYDYIWYLENDKALYVLVYPGETMQMNYTEGNYDDDFYWYYEDYWYY